MNKALIRHLAGGFGGGLLGILFGGYVHPIGIPVGCFLGAVLGYWHDVVLQTIANHPFKKMAQRMHPHPMTVSQIAAFAVATLFVIVNIAQVYGFYRSATYLAGEYDGTAVLLSIMWLFGTAFAMIFGVGMFVDDVRGLEQRGMSAFYNEFELWNRDAAHFLLGKALSLVRSQVVLMILAFLIFCGFVGAIVMIVCIVLPVAVFYGTVKGTIIGARRGGYWLCFGTSLVVTSVMAYFMYPQFENQSILWVTALGAGSVSAAASEGLRQAALWLLTVSPRARQLKRLKIGDKKVTPIFEWASATAEKIFTFIMDNPLVGRITPTYMRS